MLHRTLLIGLGGTGVNVLRKFKNHFLKFYDRDQRYVRLLGIDTANQEEIQAPKLENHEFLHLGNPAVGSAQIARYRNTDPFRWMPTELPAFNITDGAGQRRLVGHIAYFWRGADIAVRIQAAMNDLYNADVSREFEGLDEGANTRVFVVSSLCGGTGTGMFLDIGYLVNHIFMKQNHHTTRFGLLFMPSSFGNTFARDPTQFRVVQANGYAALLELNYYMQDMIEESQLYAPLQNEPRIPISPKPFNVCFMLGSPDEAGKVLSNVASLYDRTAEFLFAAVAFPQIQTQLVDHLAVNGRFSYATFGSFSIPLPKARYIERYMLKMGHELLDDVFSGNAAVDYSTGISSVLTGSGIELLQGMESLQPLQEIGPIMAGQIFVHNTPANQKAASEAIDAEYQHWMALRGQQLQKANLETAQIVRTIEERLDDELKRLSSLDKGSLASIHSLLDAAIARFDTVLLSLGSVAPSQTEGDVYGEFHAASGVLGMGGKSAADRLNGFRYALPVAACSQMAAECRNRARALLGQLRGKVVDQRAHVAQLLTNGKVTLAEFDTRSEQFLRERRSGGSAANLMSTGVGQGNVDSAQYEVDRIGLLQRCRARLQLNSLVDSKWTVDVAGFVERLYGETSAYVSDRVSTAQLLDQDALLDGLNQAWTNLSMQQGPGANRWINNKLFAPNDANLRAQIREIVQRWPGLAAGVDFEDSVDDSILSFLRIVGKFSLEDITETKYLKQAYEAQAQTQDAFFLHLPTHRTYEVVVENLEAEKSKRYALAICSGMLEDFGLTMKFAGTMLREVADPVDRRRAAQEMLLNPDRYIKVQRALDKLRNESGSNSAYADALYERLQKNYPEEETYDGPADDLERMKADERRELLNYLASLGVRKYASGGGINR